MAGLFAFGAQSPNRAPPVVPAYFERETSTILRIKVAKANITPRAMHAVAKFTSHLLLCSASKRTGGADARRPQDMRRCEQSGNECLGDICK